MPVKLVDTDSFVSELVSSIQLARKRVYVLSLIIEQSNDASPIVTALIRAASRGVDVRVMADYSTYSYSAGHLKPFSGIRDSHYLANRLQAHGVSFHWLGKNNPFLFAGRTHSKWTIVDERVYAFGGINLHAKLQSDSDYMMVVTEPGIADLLTREFSAIFDADTMESVYMSHSYQTDIGEILIDGGLIFDSIIYRRALELVKTSHNVLLVTQYCPTGRLAGAIKNIEHQVYYNTPTTEDPFTNALIRFGERVTGISNLYSHKHIIHAKFMIATDANGKKTAITGSHNFISYGGILGTREIALLTTDTHIINSLEKFYEEHIA